MNPVTDVSATYAAEVASLLWSTPGHAAHITRSRHRRGPHRDFYIFPSDGAPGSCYPPTCPVPRA